MQYAVLITVTANPQWDSYDGRVKHDLNTMRAAGLSLSSGGCGEDSEYHYLADETPSEPGEFWYEWGRHAVDFRADGIIPADSFAELVDDLGAFATSIPTMGTLGGPANPCGIAPDIAFEVESDDKVYSMRVTPMPEVEIRDRWRTVDPWPRIAQAVMRRFGAFHQSGPCNNPPNCQRIRDGYCIDCGHHTSAHKSEPLEG